MPFTLPDPYRASASPAPEPTTTPAERPLTEEEERLLADPAFVAAFFAWRERQR